MDDIRRINGEDKVDGRDLGAIRRGLIEQIGATPRQLIGQLARKPESVTNEPEQAEKVEVQVETSVPIASAKSDRRSQREIDTMIGIAARCSPSTVRRAWRLFRSGHQQLVIAVMVNAVSLSAAVSAVTPKSNAGLRAERRRLLELLAS
jgi:hypothetical protein